MTDDLFVTGTDTGMGKTVLSALLVAALGATYWKPIQSGSSEGTDRATVMRLAEIPEERTLPENYSFGPPVSPHLAAEWAGERIDLAQIMRPSRNSERIVAEGAGGVLVPINDTQTMLDLIRHLAMPVVVASRTALGTINHTTLTVHELRNARADVKGVVLIGPENKDNLRAIERYAAIPVVGWIPHLGRIDRSTLLEVFRDHFDHECFA